MKIYRLPDEYNIDVYNRERILEESKNCPYCGDNSYTKRILIDKKEHSLYDYDWNGFAYLSIPRKELKQQFPRIKDRRKIRRDKGSYYYTTYKCNCGAVWMSDIYKKERR